MSDMSVFHRVDDVAALTISRFLMLAARLAAYAGAVRARQRQQPQTAGTASPANVPAGGATQPSGGDTPPEVVKAMKAQQFAARHARMTGKPVDPASIRWDDDEVLRELVKGG